jgi:hypothetical protein
MLGTMEKRKKFLPFPPNPKLKKKKKQGAWSAR